MTITPLETTNLEPRDEPIGDITMILDEAIIDDEFVSVHEVARRSVEAMDELQAG